MRVLCGKGRKIEVGRRLVYARYPQPPGLHLVIAGSIGVTDDAPSPSLIPIPTDVGPARPGCPHLPFTMGGRLISSAVPMHSDDLRLIRPITHDAHRPLLSLCGQLRIINDVGLRDPRR